MSIEREFVYTFNDIFSLFFFQHKGPVYILNRIDLNAGHGFLLQQMPGICYHWSLYN